jgi:glycosyltransferase involved in cell wall biosynthesis
VATSIGVATSIDDETTAGTSMAKICIVTQDPALRGGVLTKLREFLDYALTREHRCDIYHAAECHPGDRRRATPPAELETHPAVERVIAVPVLDVVPHHLRADMFARRWRPQGSYNAYHVISGSLWQALPLARADKTFVASIACTFAAEARGLALRSTHHYFLYNPLAMWSIRRQERFCGLQAERVLVDSTHSAKEVVSELGIEQSRVRVVPSPVDVDRLVPGQAVTAPRRYLLSVARLDRRKDFPTLVRAFHRLAKTVDDVELRIVGEGAEQAAIEALVGELGLRDRVTLLGRLTEEELRDQYRGASAFTLASRQEGIGIVFLEAMACGLPIVATHSGGVADPIEHEATGLLVPVGNDQALAERLAAVLASAPLAERLGGAARVRAIERFSRERISQQLDETYAAVFGLVYRTDDLAAA